MSINAGDIKFVKSAVMDDVPEGGGAPTALVINTGMSNSIFPDISELDRAGGRVNMRKVFATVRTANVDGFFGANIIVAEPFQDPRVTVTLAPTDSFFDRRSDAASRLEAYLGMGPVYSGYLFGDHIAGQMSVSILQRLERPIPPIGSTFVLMNNIGLANQYTQYLRVTDVDSTERTFTDTQGDFTRRQVILSISDQLGQDFPGFDAFRIDSSVSYTGKTRINETVVADAARYYGVVPLTEQVDVGDFTVKAQGIYTQLVPSTRQESPIADARMNQQSATLVKAGEKYNRTITMNFTTQSSMFVGGGILPGSVEIDRGGVKLTDKGGLLINAAGDQVGNVDYSNGVFSLTQNVYGTTGGSHAVSYTPAYAPTLVSETIEIPITTESQRLNFAFTIDPPPARGTMQISFRALGRWYELRDDGSGALRGSDSSFGAGTLNFSTGTVTVTLGALPDVDSSVLVAYVASVVARPIETITQAGPSLPRAFGKIFSLGKAIKPGTLSITWNDGTGRTATDSSGVLSGGATGRVNYATGVIEFRPNILPAKDTAISVSITETAKSNNSVSTFTDSGANWTFTLPTPIKAGTVEIALLAQYPKDPYRGGELTYLQLRIFDDGAGNLKFANQSSNDTIGTINYSTGACSIPKQITNYKVDQPQFQAYSTLGFFWTAPGNYYTTPVSLTIANGPGATTYPTPPWAWWSGAQSVAAQAQYAGGDSGAQTFPLTFNEIFLPSNPGGYDAVTGTSAKLSSFFLGGEFFTVRESDGNVIRSPDPTTGNGVVSGARAVVGGMSGVILTGWPTGISSAPTGVAGAAQPALSGVDSLATVDHAVFRTAISPLVTSGFQIAGNWTRNGAAFTATADSNGLINTTSAVSGSTPGSYGVVGRVNYEMGIATVRFGRRVPASMAGQDFVVDLTDLGIAGVTYFQLAPVQADTLRYNATGYSYLPLDPDILGLSPVRLPPDGRVPIFRPGTFAVLGHTGSVSATVANGNTISCGRTRLSRVEVVGNNGNLINTGWTADLDAGTVTFTDVTGYSQPVTIRHRIEDTVQVSDAQINGQLTFTRPSTHVYPVPGSYVSSAVVAGDVRARTSLVFDQNSWNNVWSDTPGTPANASFNDTANPITVSNLGALTERWAVVFTSSTAFQVIGEHVGVIAVGNTGSDCSPMNTEEGAPYFTIPAAGWGLGWAVGNVLRFNTVGAKIPLWMVRTILAGPETVTDDSFLAIIRGDVDRP